MKVLKFLYLAFIQSKGNARHISQIHLFKKRFLEDKEFRLVCGRHILDMAQYRGLSRPLLPVDKILLPRLKLAEWEMGRRIKAREKNWLSLRSQSSKEL